jgi:hypothetical protein
MVWAMPAAAAVGALVTESTTTARFVSDAIVLALIAAGTRIVIELIRVWARERRRGAGQLPGTRD